MKNILLLGIGNDILSDDGIGIKLVNHLESHLISEKIDFLTAVIGGMELIELLNGYEQAIIIDAIRTGEGAPGTVYHMKPANFKETLHMSSFHDMSFLTALQFAKKMKIQIPERIDIIAIEIVEDLLFSNEFSPAIQKHYHRIKEEVNRLVHKLITK